MRIGLFCKRDLLKIVLFRERVLLRCGCFAKETCHSIHTYVQGSFAKETYVLQSSFTKETQFGRALLRKRQKTQKTCHSIHTCTSHSIHTCKSHSIHTCKSHSIHTCKSDLPLYYRSIHKAKGWTLLQKNPMKNKSLLQKSPTRHRSLLPKSPSFGSSAKVT